MLPHGCAATATPAHRAKWPYACDMDVLVRSMLCSVLPLTKFTLRGDSRLLLPTDPSTLATPHTYAPPFHVATYLNPSMTLREY